MIVIDSKSVGKRLDKLLSNHYPAHSRSYFQALIDEGHVLVNGHPVKKQYKPSLSDSIKISFQEPPILDVLPEAIPLSILYEDDHIIAINKPAGMVVHPGAGVHSGTFANALLYHCKSLSTDDFDPFRPGIVHRIDKDTTGVLLGAKTRPAHQKLVEMFSRRQVEKRYLAICCGVPPEGKYSAPIKRHPIRRKEMTISSDGKEAISHFKILAKRESLTLLEAMIETGRTHQIRVHLKSLNCPVLGDSTYGSESLNQKYKVSSQLLHAERLKLTHPISEISLELISPIPPSMKNFIDLIG